MSKFKVLVALLAVTVAPITLAGTMSPDTAMSSACSSIASACKTAGFDDAAAPGKQFWMDCMKPVILGQAVAGINVDKKTAQACKAEKIKELKAELKELKNSKS